MDYQTPKNLQLPEGRHEVVVPRIVEKNGIMYKFQQWENGDLSPNRLINIHANMGILASFEPLLLDSKTDITIKSSSNSKELLSNLIFIEKENAKIETLNEEETKIIQAKLTYLEVLRNVLLLKQVDLKSLQKVKEWLCKKNYYVALKQIFDLEELIVVRQYYPLNENETMQTERMFSDIRNNLYSNADPAVCVNQKLDATIKDLNGINSKIDKLSMYVKDLGTEIAELHQSVNEIVEKYPQNVIKLVNENSSEFIKILTEISDQLNNRDRQKSNEAKKWISQISQTISVVADVVSLFSFLTGVSSLPPDLTNRMIHLFEKLKCLVPL